MKVNSFKDELKQLDAKELLVKLDTLRREQFSLKLNASTSHLKDYSQFGKTCANIARVLTELRIKGVKC